MNRRISPSAAVLSASAVLGVVAGAIAWPQAGPAMSLCLMVAVLFVGALTVAIGRWVEDQIERRARGRRAAQQQRERRERQSAPPLPRRWTVPDYPPDDLRPPTS